MDNDYVWANRLLGGALLASGRRNEALRTLERVVESQPRDPLSLAWLAYARTVTGDKVHAVDLLEHLEQLADERYVSPYHMAIVHFGLGDVEATCRALRQAEEDRDPMLANLNVDPRLAELRQHARTSRHLSLPDASGFSARLRLQSSVRPSAIAVPHSRTRDRRPKTGSP